MATIHRFSPSFSWDGVETETYDVEGAPPATKRVLVGPDDGSRDFALRYFEIPPAGRSSIDRHPHDHGVVILRGSGVLRLGDETHRVSFGDAIYIGPDEPHVFENTSHEPFGFLCVKVVGERSRR